VRRGEDVRLRTRGVEPGARVVVSPAGTDPATLSAAREAGPDDIVVATKDMTPGAYEVALLDRSGRRASAASFWLASAAARPAVTIERERVKAGEPIDVRWTEAPGYRWDWVGVYPEEVAPDAEGQPLVWLHTRATVAGAWRLDGTAEGDGWPLRPGAYRVYLFEDDAYQPLAGARFTVEP
jgi:hypothetical protein